MGAVNKMLTEKTKKEVQAELHGEKENAPTVENATAGNAEKELKRNVEKENTKSFLLDNIIPPTEGKVNTFRCNIDKVAYKDKESAKRDTTFIVNRTKQESQIKALTPLHLSDLVTQGYSFTTAALKGTKEKDFVSQQLAVLDIDNSRENVPVTTVEDAVKVLAEHKIDYSFMYYSFSHSDALPKFRIVCVLDEPITEPQRAKELNKYLISLFPQADPTCHNLDRFYYGTDKGLATEVHNRTTTITAPEIFKPLEIDTFKTEPKQENAPPISEPTEGNDTDNGKKIPSDKFILKQAIQDFNLLEYVEQTTGTKGVRKGKDVLFNPCPLCGHQGDFYIDTDRNLYKCHGASNGTGGNIINYLMQRDSLSKTNAREHFIYDIMRQDRKAQKQVYKEQKRAERRQNGESFEAEQYDEITIFGVENHLKIKNISVKYNQITRKVDIKGLDEHHREHIADSLPILVYNDLKLMFKNCAKGDIQDFLGVISTNNAYNPVLEMLDSGKWDGVDRLPELYRIMRIDQSDKLSRRLIYKWLWQSLSMVRNDFNGAYGADGLLVLQGEQGIGKTSLVRKLAVRQEFCLIGKSLNFQDKDTLRRCASAWIVELGEIETTFKSDKEKLKAFITDEIDMYRLPYGRTDVELARRTSLIGTCNSTEYLIDETGNRRFWTISIKETMDLKALEKFDALQLWLQIDSLTKHDRQGFRLTVEERAALNNRNIKHEKPLKAEIEVRDVINKRLADNQYFEKEVTITEFKTSHKALEKFDAREIGKVLDKMGIEQKKKKIQGAVVRVRSLPMLAEDFKTWEQR